MKTASERLCICRHAEADRSAEGQRCSRQARGLKVKAHQHPQPGIAKDTLIDIAGNKLAYEAAKLGAIMHPQPAAASELEAADTRDNMKAIAKAIAALLLA